VTDPGPEIRLVDDPIEARRVGDLFDQVWGATTSVVGMELIRAIGHAGGYVAAAYEDEAVVGGSLGFLGRHLGAPSLHSHVTGILPGVRRTGIGRAMKLHQRSWAAANGLTWVTWTFDPLVRRNAWFNLGVLGAVVHEYLVDFYGPIDDAINAGDESDRCLVSWPLAGERAVAASHGAAVEPDLEDLRERGAPVLLGLARESPAGEAAPGAPDLAPLRGGAPASGSFLLRVPEDVVAIRATDRALASRWRRAVRVTMGEAIARGFAATGITRSGWYVLGRSRQESR
jgi:predicted GNAT superfamily acetyltransferase